MEGVSPQSLSLVIVDAEEGQVFKEFDLDPAKFPPTMEFIEKDSNKQFNINGELVGLKNSIPVSALSGDLSAISKYRLSISNYSQSDFALMGESSLVHNPNLTSLSSSLEILSVKQKGQQKTLLFDKK
jgi:hypothetical protein